VALGGQNPWPRGYDHGLQGLRPVHSEPHKTRWLGLRSILQAMIADYRAERMSMNHTLEKWYKNWGQVKPSV
jgi:hypothetical protein